MAFLNPVNEDFCCHLSHLFHGYVDRGEHGDRYWAVSMSSMLMTERSSGITSPASLMALMAPMAVLSLQQNTADTSVLRDRSSLAPLYPPLGGQGNVDDVGLGRPQIMGAKGSAVACVPILKLCFPYEADSCMAQAKEGVHGGQAGLVPVADYLVVLGFQQVEPCIGHAVKIFFKKLRVCLSHRPRTTTPSTWLSVMRRNVLG